MYNKNFAGRNGYIWWTGVVEDRKDPMKTGRVRVRIIGWHPEGLTELPTEQLPWAIVLLPTSGAKAFSGPKEGDWVHGHFLDGESGQQPVVVGVYPGMVSQKTKTPTTTTQKQLDEAKAELETLTYSDPYGTGDGASIVNAKENAAAIEAQKTKIAALEKEIATQKANASKRPPTGFVDTRTQAQVNAAPIPPAYSKEGELGKPNTPRLSQGVVTGTGVEDSNKKVEHVCDFISEMQKNINLKKYTKAIANKIREAIRAIMRALGISDATGQYSWLIDKLKSFAREAKRIQKEIIQPIIDFEKYVLAYITKLRAIIAWILSLPARLLAILQDCLQRLLKLIANIFSDIGQGFSDGLSDSSFQEVIDAAKEAANAAVDTVKAASTAAAGVAIIATSATAGLLIPANAAELEQANATIAAYEKTVPTTAESTPASQDINKKDVV
jgi:hypothetical protein